MTTQKGEHGGALVMAPPNLAISCVPIRLIQPLDASCLRHLSTTLMTRPSKVLFLFAIRYGSIVGEDLIFRVEVWDERDVRVEEVVALVADLFVARAAFVETVRRRPGRIVTLRQKARLLADSRKGSA